MQLGMLPLMQIYEIADIMFFINSINNITLRFNILNYVQFSTGTTRSAGCKLYHKTASINSVMNSYFYRLPKLWNCLPIIDLSQPPHIIKSKLKRYFWNHFLNNFDNDILCTFHYLCPCTRCTKSPVPCNHNYL